MDLTTLTSIGQYIKTLELKTTWQVKQEKGDYTGHGGTLEEWLGDTRAPSSPSDRDYHTGDTKLQTIQMKVFHGKTLTPKEKEYLREKDPETYEKVRNLEREKAAYERALKRCRTKEEVQRLKLSHLGTSLSTVNAIKNNPNISKSKKLEILMVENGKISMVNRATREFVRLGKYKKLPSEQTQPEIFRPFPIKPVFPEGAHPLPPTPEDPTHRPSHEADQGKQQLPPSYAQGEKDPVSSADRQRKQLDCKA